MIRHLFLVSCLFLLSCSSVGDKLELINISGIVVDSDTGLPLSNLRVDIYDFPKWNSYVSEYSPIISTSTNENGEFEFDVKVGVSLEIVSKIFESDKIGAMYRISKVKKDQSNIVLRHDVNSIGLIKEPPIILKK